MNLSERNLTTIRKHKVKFLTDPKTGDVTMFLAEGTGGPIMRGKDYYDAYVKMKEALELMDVVVTFEKITKWNKDFKNN